ncbi:uncharacterized protein LOC120328885 [Styela clava]
MRLITLYLAFPFILVVFAVVTEGNKNETCVPTPGSKYVFCGQMRKTPKKAREICKRIGGNLASINSDDDQRDVEKAMGSKPNCDKLGGGSRDLVYIGLSDREDDGKWIWENGKPLLKTGFTNWFKQTGFCKQQPNGNCVRGGKIIPDQDYTAIQRCEGISYGRWFDVIGDRAHAFICEITEHSKNDNKAGYDIFSTTEPQTQSRYFQSSGTMSRSYETSVSVRYFNHTKESSIPLYVSPTTSQQTKKSAFQMGADNRRNLETTSVIIDQKPRDAEDRKLNSRPNVASTHDMPVSGRSSPDHISPTTYFSKIDDEKVFEVSYRRILNFDNSKTSIDKRTDATPGSSVKNSKNSVESGNSFESSSTTASTQQTTSFGETNNEVTGVGNRRIIIFDNSKTSIDKKTDATPRSSVQNSKNSVESGNNFESSSTTVSTRQTTSFSETNNEETKQPDNAIQFSTPNVGNTEQAGGDSHVGKSEGSVEDMLECLILSLQTDEMSRDLFSKRCPGSSTRFILNSNPIEIFEETVALPFAKLIMKSNINSPISAKTPGIDMTITPVRQMQRSSDLHVSFTSEESCKTCDSVTVDGSDFYQEDRSAVLVSAILKKNLLKSSGVYDYKYVKEKGKRNSYYNTADFFEESTSVMSVTLFVSNKTKDGDSVSPLSVSTSMVFDIRNDTSEVLFQNQGRQVISANRKCVFYSNAEKAWSDYGCTTIYSNDGGVRCESNHTTIFAVMVSIRSFELPAWLKIFLLFIEIIGIVFLCTTLCVLIWLRRNLRKDRVLTQINLTLSLILLHVSMLIAGQVHRIEGLCVTMTLLSHFFLISSAMWMINEGWVLYKKTCGSALNFDITKLRRWLLLTGWIIPLLYVLICLGIGLGLEIYIDTSKGYQATVERQNQIEKVNKYDRCWLGTETLMVLSSIVPLSLALIVSVYFIVRVSRVIWFMNVHSRDMRPSDAAAKREPLQATLRAVALLLPVLGIPWILAFFVNIPGAEVAFAAIHGVANGLQGVFLFAIYIVTNGEARTTAKRRVSRKSMSSSLSFSFSVSSSALSVKKGKSHKGKSGTYSENHTTETGNDS